MKLAFVMPFNSAFARASSTAAALSSIPITRLATPAMQRPMVPVPQQTSSTTVSGPT